MIRTRPSYKSRNRWILAVAKTSVYVGVVLCRQWYYSHTITTGKLNYMLKSSFFPFSCILEPYQSISPAFYMKLRVSQRQAAWLYSKFVLLSYSTVSIPSTFRFEGYTCTAVECLYKERQGNSLCCLEEMA